MKKLLNMSVLVTIDNPKGQKATETFRTQHSKNGLTEKNAQALKKSSGFVNYLLTGIKRFFMKYFFMRVPEYELARTILGKDFIPPERIMRSCKGIAYTNKQLAQFKKTVPAREILEWCRDNNFMLIAGPDRPMSFLEINVMRSNYFYFGKSGFYADRNFSQKDKVETKWHMICKVPAPESVLKSWEEQQDTISDVETVPNVAEFTWAITTYKKIRGVYLFHKFYVRTSSLDLDGNHISVGNFDKRGMFIDAIRDGLRFGLLGLSVTRNWYLKP